MNKIQQVFSYIISKFTPVIKNTVFFDSFLGQYCDNPKFISQELHRIDPDVTIVWSVSGKSKETPPEYAKTVQYGSKDYYRFALNSEAVVDNHIGIRTMGFRNFRFKGFFQWMLKKPHQLAIATWHGTPVKKVGKDQINRPTKTYLTGIDYCIYGCDLTRDVIGEAFFVKDIMKPYGTPRNDKLVVKPDESEIRILKTKLKIPVDKRVVLFAPTFREDIDLSGLTQLRDLNIEKLLRVLEKKFQEKFVFAFRAHHSVIEKMQYDVGLDKNNIIDGNIGDDMTEYLVCTDILLTDYSSSMFDFALTDKPCFLYTPDYAHYLNERGLYLDFDSLPFSRADSVEELFENIKEFDMAEYLEKKNDLLSSINNIEDGNAAYRIARDISIHLKRN